jgi:lycopene beta-cyclase
MKPDYDIVFAGAGLSGLSLAARLAALPDPPRMLLVDPRQDESSDRTWCHWQLREGIFADAITHRWHCWNVRDGHNAARASSQDTPYVRIPSDRFRQIALRNIAACPRAEILRGTSVASIEEAPDRNVVQLSDGRRIESSWVFDSRPLQNDNAPWRQIFRGLELQSPEANLDTSAVTLMDFQSAGPEGVRFFYVLPLDAHTALVEDTWLVPSHKTPAFSDDAIVSYASKTLGKTHWQIRHQEEGNLPMGFSPSAHSASFAYGPSTSRRGGTPVAVDKLQRIIPWGTPAGAVRASSGYAFSRIQRASESMAQHWSQHRCPSPAITHESKLLAWMDRVFLRVMERHPDRVPEFFFRMFERVPPDALVRFLESEPRPADIFRVMRSLPAAPFLAAALR